MDAHSDNIHAAFLMALRQHGMLMAIEAVLLLATYTVLYRRNDYLLNPAQIATKIWFLQFGYVRWFKEDANRQTTLWLSTPGSIILVPSSFQQQIPSTYYLQALSPCKTVCLDYKNVLKLWDEHPHFRTVISKISDEHTAETHEYAETMRLEKAEERMKYLHRKIGSDIYSLSAEALSSFINMSERNFYKIRKKLTE